MAAIAGIQSALAGLQSNLERFDRAAARVATPPLDENLAQDLVDLTVAQRGFEASVAVVRAEDDLIGTLLDVLR